MQFIDQYSKQVSGVLHCYDRIIIQGTIPGICYAGGMNSYLYARNTAQQAMDFIYNKFSNADVASEDTDLEKMLVQLEGCEIRKAELIHAEEKTELTPVHKNPKMAKTINWRNVRLGFVRPLDSEPRIFTGGLDSYPKVVGQMHSAAVLIGMTPKTEIVGVADGGIGLSEELKKQFPSMLFVYKKTYRTKKNQSARCD